MSGAFSLRAWKLVAVNHQAGAEGVVGLACGFQRGLGLEAFREGESAETVGGRIAQIILQRRREEPGPNFVDAGLHNAEGTAAVKREYIQRDVVHHLVPNKYEGKLWRYSTRH
jgi:hypothetical protein